MFYSDLLDVLEALLEGVATVVTLPIVMARSLVDGFIETFGEEMRERQRGKEGEQADRELLKKPLPIRNQ